MSFSQNFKQLEKVKFKYSLYKIQTPLSSAITEIEQRQKNTELKNAINEFLEGDIPLHFRGREPIFYLSRYIATPDYETLKYYDQVKEFGWPIVIGEDATDIFTSHSSLKRNLMKLPIVDGTARDGSGIVRYETIVDFNSEQGKPLRDITLTNHLSLKAFHRDLCTQFLPKEIKVVNESDWVDRHSRGKLITLYENMLALFILHGIMLEQYEPDEIDFLEAVVLPAYKITKKRFGYCPLIAPLDVAYSKKIQDLNSYPSTVGKYVRKTLSREC